MAKVSKRKAQLCQNIFTWFICFYCVHMMAAIQAPFNCIFRSHNAHHQAICFSCVVP
ncbi:hypothetical protein BX661DRAFT_178670 [Kickxella alabastrina]|uniref:uncharacterized protein n=1 Tax=Kickxella alabastrina TaxID=61397 RepID=UPI00221E56D7|nr:uncharacterized protein BX661DRAFT_178670 [Kickxella alabastrina]KAI7833584.1 hypothetical protein BX661DRAFT_178670 [Kickxella alabastrina]